jgi:hypothetical protein
MEEILSIVFDSLAHGGPNAIIMVQFLFMLYLAWDRHTLIKTLKSESSSYHTDLLAVIDKYQQGQINMIQAFNELKLILVKLEAKA